MMTDFQETYRQKAEQMRERSIEEQEREALEEEDTPAPDLASVITGWPAPLDPAAFHGLPGEIVRTLDPHTESDPVAILFQVLAAFGNAVGGRPFFRAEADRHTANLYVGLVGDTARSRKGTSWGHVRRLMEIADSDWLRDRNFTGLSSGEGVIYNVRDPIEQQQPVKEKGRVVDYETVVTDHGVPDKRLFVYQSELATVLRVMGREGNTLSAVLRQAWDCGSLGTLTKNSPVRATGAHVSIVGHVTRPELLKYLAETEQANGFANRFLWICAKKSKSLPEGGNLDRLVTDRLGVRLREALAFARDVDEVFRDEVARGIWIQIYDELSRGRPGILGAITARAEAQVMRLALIYALLDKKTIISAEHLKAGIAAWDYADASARYIFGEATGDRTADRILAAIRQSEYGLTRTELRDLFDRHKSSREIDRALATLAAAALVECREEQSGGRPVERWVAL